MDAGQRYTFNRELNYATTQIELKQRQVDAIFNAPDVANFINPTAALGLAGAGLGGLRGATQQDEFGMPISTGDRLRRVAVNAAGGGALGAGSGVLAKQFRPEILRSIDQAPAKGLKGAREVLDSNLGDQAADIAASNRKLQAKIAQEATDRENLAAARQAQKEARRQQRVSARANTKQRFDGVVEDIQEARKQGAAKRAAIGQNIQGAKAVAAEALSPVTSAAKNVADVATAAPREIQEASQALGTQIGKGLGAALTSDAGQKIMPQAQNSLRSLGQGIVNKGRQDIATTQRFLSRLRGETPRFSANHIKAAQFGLFEPEQAKIIGAGLGTGVGATLGAAEAIKQNSGRQDKAYNSIYSIGDPAQRVQAFDDFTSNPDAAMRGAGEATNILGKTALGAGAGAVGGGLLLGAANKYIKR